MCGCGVSENGKDNKVQNLVDKVVRSGKHYVEKKR